MKLYFASVATGIAVIISILITVVFVRALFRDDASVMFAAWFFGWPSCFIGLLPGIPANALTWISLATGTLLDMVLVSGVTYCVLKAIVSRQKRTHTAVPPQAPTF